MPFQYWRRITVAALIAARSAAQADLFNDAAKR
jgi:hypothetical protein